MLHDMLNRSGTWFSRCDSPSWNTPFWKQNKNQEQGYFHISPSLWLVSASAKLSPLASGSFLLAARLAWITSFLTRFLTHTEAQVMLEERGVALPHFELRNMQRSGPLTVEKLQISAPCLNLLWDVLKFDGFKALLASPFLFFNFFCCLLHCYFVSSRQAWCRSSSPSPPPSLMTAHFSVASALLTDWLTDAAHLRWFMCHRAGDQMGQMANGGRRPGRFTRRQNRPHRSAIYSSRWQDQTSAL